MLSGTRVVELATMAAAPGCGAVLADLGAAVVKVETPAGDPWRKTGQFYRPEREFGAMFEQDNRGKKSISLDLSTPAGAQLFHLLLERADVFLTNVRRSGLQRLGLDWEQVQERYPRLIYCHLTGWGREGPFADKAGYDIGRYLPILAAPSAAMSPSPVRSICIHVLFSDHPSPPRALCSYGAATGLMELGRPSSDSSTEMSRWPTGQGDHAASMSAVAGVGLALNHRHDTGRGQLVDISLLRAGAWANSHRYSRPYYCVYLLRFSFS
jgi:crotonobetainyl-CoA:carnitine CoA-transferase CaiB-like acyl-CoA transferase